MERSASPPTLKSPGWRDLNSRPLDPQTSAACPRTSTDVQFSLKIRILHFDVFRWTNPNGAQNGGQTASTATALSAVHSSPRLLQPTPWELRSHGSIPSQRCRPPSGHGFMSKVSFSGCGWTRPRTRAERHLGPTTKPRTSSSIEDDPPTPATTTCRRIHPCVLTLRPFPTTRPKLPARRPYAFKARPSCTVKMQPQERS